jgi:negative regulator of flagellin synthesis FlgM
MKVADTSQIRALDPNRQGELSRTQKAEQPDTEDRVSTEQSARVAAAVAQVSLHAGAADRAEMLRAVETAVRQGTYMPDPARIAERILEQAELAARLQALLQR